MAVLSFADCYWELVDSLSATKLWPLVTEHFAFDSVIDRQKIFFCEVVSGVLCWRFLFHWNYHHCASRWTARWAVFKGASSG